MNKEFTEFSKIYNFSLFGGSSLGILRSHYDHTEGASRLERESSAKFTVIWINAVVKSHLKIQGS